MSNNVFEEAPQSPQPSGGAIDKVRKAARQLAYDVRYKVKGKFKEGQKTDPASLQRAYIQQLGASSAPGPVKLLAKKMLMGVKSEQYDFAMVESSLPQIFNKVFVEGVGEYVLRVKDPKAGSQYTRSYGTYAAAEAKASELRKKGLRVELATASSSAKKGTYDNKGGDKPNDGNLANNRKPYDKVTRGDVIAGATGKDEMGGKRKVNKEEVIYETEDEQGKKLDVMKGKNKVVINPNVLENATQYFYDQGYNEEDIAIISEGMGYDMFLEFVNEVGSTICLYEDVQGELLTKGGKARKNPKITKSAGTASEISPNKSKETKKPEEKKSSPGQISINYNKKPSPPGQEKIKQGIQTAVRKATSPEAKKKVGAANTSPPGQEKIKQGIQTAVKKATSPEAKKKVGGAVKGAANTAARVALSAWKGHQAAMKKKKEGGSIAQQIGSGAGRAVGSFLKKGKSHLENYEPTVREGIKAELDALKAQRVEEETKSDNAAKEREAKEREAKKREIEIRTAMRDKDKRMLRIPESVENMRYCPDCEKDETREECKYGTKNWDERSQPTKAEDPRSMPTRINLAKNKLRAMGLKMSYDMEGDMVDEKYQGMYQSPAPTYNRLNSKDPKARMSPGSRAMAKSDKLQSTEPGSKRAKKQNKVSDQINRNFQSARKTVGEGSSVEDEMEVSRKYFKQRNSRSPEEKKAEADNDAKSRAKNYAMHKRPDPYRSRPGESD